MKRYLMINLGVAALGAVKYPAYIGLGAAAAYVFDKLIVHGFLPGAL